MAITTTEATQIKKLVAAMFNLAPSAAIYDDIISSFESSGNNLSLLAANLSASGVFQNQISGLDNAGLANKLMTSLGLTAGTTAGDAAYDYFIARLGQGVTLDQVSVEATAYLADDTKRSTHFNDTVALLDNKTTVTDAFISSGIVATAATELDFVSAVTADESTVAIVTNLVDMAKESSAALAETLNTLTAVKELIDANASDATASAAVLANLAVVIENVAASNTSGAITDISSTLTAVTATVTAAKTDASFIANPETLATSIATDPTAVEENAADVVEEAATPTPPSSSSSSGGSSTPAPTFTVTIVDDMVTFSGTATGNISMSITDDVATFTRGGIDATTTAALGGTDAIAGITVASGQTLADTAADLTGLTIDGEGTVNITALEDTLDADLSGITATTVTVTGNFSQEHTIESFSGKLGNAKLIVTSTVGGGIDITSAVELNTNATYEVGANAFLLAKISDLSGKEVTGDGGIGLRIYGTDSASTVDTTNISLSDIQLLAIESVDISNNSLLENVTLFLITENNTLTLTAAQALSKSISGEGSVTVKEIAADTDLSTITATGTLSATVTETLDLTEANLSGLDALTISDGTDTVITATVTPEQYAALVGKVTLDANDRLVSTDTDIPTSTIDSAAFDENTGTFTLTGTNFDTILETTEDATTDVKARLDWSKLSWDINGDDTTTANVSFEVGDISSVKVTDATTLTITLTNTKTAALIDTTDYNTKNSSAVDKIDVSAGFIRDMSHNAATTDAAADAAVVITQDSAAPTITSVTVADGTYKIGDAVAVTVTAENDETGLTLAGTFNGQILSAITDNGDGTYTGTYTVVSGNTDVADAGSVTTSITLTDAASNVSEATTSVTLAGESIDANAPTAPTGVTLTPVGGTVVTNTLNGTNTNLTASATITAGEATGGSAVLKVNGTTIATDSTIESGDTTVSFDLEKTTVEELQAAVAAGGTVTVEAIDAAGNATASTASNPTLTVDYTAPSASSVAITSATGHNASIGTINGGSLITVTVAFDEAVTITGTPQLGLAVGSDTVQASYLSGTGTAEIVFKTTDYLFDKNDADGVAIAQNALSLNSGTIKDAAGNDAIITHSAVADNSAYKLDGTAPTASNFTVTSTTVGATINEIGELGIFNNTTHNVISNITSVTGLAADTAGTVTVAAQSAITAATLQPMDAAGNGSIENLSVILGTADADTTGFTEASAGQAIFGFAGADALTLLGRTIDTSISMFADYTVGSGGDSIVCGGTAAAWTTEVTDWTITNGVATKTDATVLDFYTAFATATGEAGEVVAFAYGGNTYLFGEGAGADNTDNTAVVLVGITSITAVATTAGETTVLIA